MNFIARYKTPDGFDDLWLTSDGEYLTEVRFICDKSWFSKEVDLPVFRETRRWLDCYFSGREPGFLPNYRIADGLTDFRREVLEAKGVIMGRGGRTMVVYKWNTLPGKHDKLDTHAMAYAGAGYAGILSAPASGSQGGTALAGSGNAAGASSRNRRKVYHG